MIYDLKFVQTNEGKKIISFNDDCIRYSYVNFAKKQKCMRPKKYLNAIRMRMKVNLVRNVIRSNRCEEYKTPFDDFCSKP